MSGKELPVISPDLPPEYVERLLRFFNDIPRVFYVLPHACLRLHPGESVLGMCVTCGRLG